jgi:cephalosporin-C deacetylase-like acetyl esterase
MVNNNKCKRCEEVETFKHLKWECRDAKRIWQLFNEFATSANQQEEKVLENENIFKIGNMANMNKVKIKVIQGMIQVDRPTN